MRGGYPACPIIIGGRPAGKPVIWRSCVHETIAEYDLFKHGCPEQMKHPRSCLFVLRHK